MEAEFERAVRSLRSSTAEGDTITGADILTVWREHCPAKEHHLIIRIGEAVVDALISLRAGQIAKGRARLCLLLAAMEQHTLDGGKWHLRAQTLLGMPPPPLHIHGQKFNT